MTQYVVCKPLQNLASNATVKCQNEKVGCGCSWMGRADSQREHLNRNCWPLRFKQIEKEMSALKADNSRLKEVNEDVNQEISDLKEDITDMKEEVLELKDSLSDKHAEIKTKDDKISDLEADAVVKDAEIANLKTDAEALRGLHSRVFHLGNALMHEVTSLPPPPVQFLQNMQMTYIPGFGLVPTPPAPFAPVPVPADEGDEGEYGSAFAEVPDAAATQIDENEEDEEDEEDAIPETDLDAILLDRGTRRERSRSRAPSPSPRAPWHKQRRFR